MESKYNIDAVDDDSNAENTDDGSLGICNNKGTASSFVQEQIGPFNGEVFIKEEIVVPNEDTFESQVVQTDDEATPCKVAKTSHSDQTNNTYEILSKYPDITPSPSNIPHANAHLAEQSLVPKRKLNQIQVQSEQATSDSPGRSAQLANPIAAIESNSKNNEETTLADALRNVMTELLEQQKLMQQQHHTWMEEQFETQRNHDRVQRAALMNELKEFRREMSTLLLERNCHKNEVKRN